MADETLGWVQQAVDAQRQRAIERDQRKKARQDFRDRASTLWGQIEESIYKVVQTYNARAGTEALKIEDPPGDKITIRWATSEYVFCHLQVLTPPPARTPVLERFSRWLDEYGRQEEERVRFELMHHEAEGRVTLPALGEGQDHIIKGILKPWLDLL